MAGQPLQESQESLIVTNKGSGLMHARNFQDVEPGATEPDPVESRLHLMNCLGYLASAKMLSGLVTIGPQDDNLRDRYGEEASRIVIASDRKRANMMIRAKWEFAWAVGRYQWEDSGEMTGEEARAQARVMFSDFLKRYYLGDSFQASAKYRRQLEKEVRELQAARTELNREHGFRPFAAIPEPGTEPVERSQSDVPILGTAERMRAIAEDPRAGFVPHTHQEKNLVITYLDYLDNPEFPLGINNQLFEVLAHQQKPRFGGSLANGVRALESIVWQIGDHLSDAFRTVDQLQALRRELQDCSPRVTLGEELGSGHPGAELIVRAEDTREFLENGAVPGLKRDPLRTAEKRWAHGRQPGKHKTIYDQYTRPDRTKAFRQHIIKRIDTIPIGRTRQIIEEEIARETMRADFMAQRLIDAEFFDRSRITKQVSVARRKCLELWEERTGLQRVA